MRCRPPALLLLALAASACGPSLRGVADGEAFFERCYSADFDAEIAVEEKRACWSEWTEHYAGAQPLDRVTYAADRLRAIDRGEHTEHLPGLPSGSSGASVSVAAGSAGGEDADVAETSGPDDEGVGDESEEGDVAEALERPRRPRRRMVLPRNSNPQCAAIACEPEYRECMDTCARGADPCETACVVTMRACARGCF